MWAQGKRQTFSPRLLLKYKRNKMSHNRREELCLDVNFPLHLISRFIFLYLSIQIQQSLLFSSTRSSGLTIIVGSCRIARADAGGVRSYVCASMNSASKVSLWKGNGKCSCCGVRSVRRALSFRLRRCCPVNSSAALVASWTTDSTAF